MIEVSAVEWFVLWLFAVPAAAWLMWRIGLATGTAATKAVFQLIDKYNRSKNGH